jgi:TonB family protein
MKRLLVLFVFISVYGCSIAQKGAVFGAYKSLAQGDCGVVYRKLSNAEKYSSVSDALQSEISFIRAECLERDKRDNEALALYEFIIDSFPNTEYASRAKVRIKALKLGIDQLPPNPKYSGSISDTMQVRIPETVDSSTLQACSLNSLVRIPPRYPLLAIENKLEGWVKLSFSINIKGETENIVVVNSRPTGIFDNAAIQAIEQWRFIPRQINCHNNDAKTVQVLQFKLN